MSSQKSNPLPRSQGYTVGTEKLRRLVIRYFSLLRRSMQLLFFLSSQSCIILSIVHGCCDMYDIVVRVSGCTTLFCPCVTFGRIAVFANEGSSSCVAKGALYCLAATLTGCFLGGACCCGCCNRRRLKTQFRWQQNACDDCYVHCCCHCCALCQEYRHLQSLGYDPSK
ncbi:hypothetical protein EUGRSUZ_H02807, partial [Eucalyptus grandis]